MLLIGAACQAPYTPRRVIRSSAIAAVLAFGLAACGGSAATPEASPIPSQGLTSTTTSVREPPAAPTTLTETPSPQGDCAPPVADVPPPPIDDVLDYGDEFIAYLNAGGSFERLVEFADELGVLSSLGLGLPLARADLNGDGAQELVVSLVNWVDDPQQRGRLYVAMCVSGEYRLGYSSPDNQYSPTPHIEDVFDITADGLDDLIIRRRGCGAHTCFVRLEVVAWTDGELSDRMDPAEFSWPTTAIEFIGPAADGSYQITMTGTGVGSVGAGPYRERSVTWGWDRLALLFRIGERQLLPSPWRIHFVHDGDDRFAAGDYSQALELYDRVIHDLTLQDWPPGPADDEAVEARRLELAGYARFRRILTHIKLEDFEAAEADYQDLIGSHPAGSSGSGFARMGEAFRSEFTASGDFNLACFIVQEVVAASRDEFRMALDYGYENRTYTPADLCPTER
jgi:hypothetical protein